MAKKENKPAEIKEFNKQPIMPRMGDNYMIEAFKTKMADDINTCGLPIQVVMMVLDSLLFEVKNIAENQIAVEKEQYEKAMQEYQDALKEGEEDEIHSVGNSDK